jgi:hypothetical protein
MNLNVILVGLGLLLQMEIELITPIKKAKLDTTNLALKVRPGVMSYRALDSLICSQILSRG